MLRKNDKSGPSEDLQAFYEMVEESNLLGLNHPVRRGFGGALMQAKPFIGGDSFLVHAGDSYIFSENSKHLMRLAEVSDVAKADAAFLVQRVQDPRRYGVVEGTREGNGIVHVTRVVEKPLQPASKLAIMPVYAFHPVILKALEVTQSGVGGEIQLTDGIQKMVEWGLEIRAVELEENDVRLDIGSPELYWESQSLSYRHSVERKRKDD